VKDQERVGADEMQLEQIRSGGDGSGGERQRERQREPRAREMQSPYEAVQPGGQSFWHAGHISPLIESCVSQRHSLSPSFHASSEGPSRSMLSRLPATRIITASDNSESE